MDNIRIRRSLDYDLQEFDKENTPVKCSLCMAGNDSYNCDSEKIYFHKMMVA